MPPPQAIIPPASRRETRAAVAVAAGLLSLSRQVKELITLGELSGTGLLFTEQADFECISASPHTGAKVYKVTCGDLSLALKIDDGAEAKALKEACYLSNQSQFCFFPQVYFAGEAGLKQYYAMTYINGVTLADAWHESGVRLPGLMKVLNILERMPGSTPTQATSEQLFHRHFSERIERRQASLEASPLRSMMRAPALLINGVESENIAGFIRSDAIKAVMLPFSRVGAFHGDLHFGNVLLAGNKAWAVDPRGEALLPIEYDMGKILCSIHGRYDQIRRGNFSVKRVGKAEFEFQCPQHEAGVIAVFNDWVCARYGERALACAYLAEIMHFIALMPHHLSIPGNVKAFYLRTLQLIREFKENFEA